MSKARFALASVIAALMMLTGLTASASATTAVEPAKGELKITRVNYNALGADTVANRWQEAIYVRNQTGKVLDLSGVKVHDTYKNAEGEHTNSYTFPNETSLNANSLVIVSSAAGVNKTDPNATQVYYMDFKRGYNGHWLNNGGDTVFVKSKTNKLLAKFTYDFDNGYYVR